MLNIPVEIVLVIGAVIGSFKLAVNTHDNKTVCATLIDLALGVFCGIMAGYHFGSEFNIYVSGLIAVVAGACGAMILDTCLQVLPSIVRAKLKQWFK